MKSVLVVGAGPAGLVAAKTLLHSAKFEVTILEQKDRVGGMWGVRKGEYGEKFSPEMPTNLSRYTVAFSDLAWDSVNLGEDSSNGDSSGHLPMFPKAWQVGKYLETYSKKYLPDGVLFLNSRVIKAERIQQDGVRKWKVDWVRALQKKSPNEVIFNGQSTMPNKAEISSSSSVFDYLVVGSGFFSSPRPLTFDQSQANSKIPKFPVKLQHSSQFRHLTNLLPQDKETSGNIVVIGGGISGSEAAANVAFQISNARHTPGSKSTCGNCKIYHVFNRPFYCLPRYLPQEPYNPTIQNYNLAPNFLPLDMCLYNLSRRPDGPIQPVHGRMPPETATRSHKFIRKLIGGDQRDLGHPEVVYNQQQTNYPAYTGIADTYPEFVRSGVIIPVRGRVRGLEAGIENGTGVVKAMSEAPWDLNGPQETIIDKVVGVIYATGFTPHPSLSWLPQEVLDALEYSDQSHRLPILFQRNSIFNDNIPEIAFVGFYEGPFWGVMEMQARIITQKWSSDDQSHRTSLDEISQKELTETRSLRDAMLKRLNDVPQFWMNDYVGLMEGCAQDAGVQRDDSGFEGRKGPCIAARYATEDNDQSEAAKVVHELHSMLQESCDQARFVAAAAFRAMQGVWVLRRKLDSKLPGFPSGTFIGTANFHPRIPTDPKYLAEYLYIEEGTLTTDTGFILQANRRYVYRYNEAEDKISAWFVKEDGQTVDYFFNEMRFQIPSPDTDSLHKGWFATGAHLCEKDMYESHCEFRFRGASLESFGITYEVKGPKKDYTSETWYQR